MSTKVSEVLVDSLRQAGARRCYGIVGDTINHLTDAIRRSELEWVSVRHEEVGGLAAGGESYMTGELSVCAGTCGPGSLHFLNGIFESHRNGAPVVLIASSVDRSEEGLGFPQEVDQKKLYEQCSVFCERISDPDQARRITVQAAQAALTKQGVAVIIVNGDLLQQACADEQAWMVKRPTPVIKPAPQELEAIAEAVGRAERVTLYAGIGARAARAPLIELAGRIKAPIVHTTRAKEFIEPDNPYHVGMTGIIGNRAGMEAVADCDLLLTLGIDFAYRGYYPDDARVIQIDIDPARLGRRSPVDIGVVGDYRDTEGLSRAPGDRPVRRRRHDHADGGSVDPGAGTPSSQAAGVQQRFAGLRRNGAACRGLARPPFSWVLFGSGQEASMNAALPCPTQ